MSDTLIFSAKRTPIGAFGGSLSTVPANELGASSIKEAVTASGFDHSLIGECVMGNVLTAGLGQAPARQAVIAAGLPKSVASMTINKVCGSGLKSVMLGADSITLGHTKAVVVGGMENMSLAPHILPNSRTGHRMGHVKMEDTMLKDGLWDPYNNWHMGNAAELCVKEHSFTREEQDQFAIESYKKSQSAQERGLFKNELSSVEVKGRKGSTFVEIDDEPGKAKFEKIPNLRPAFDKEGTITAANASKINDGASALVLANSSISSETSVRPLAKIVGYTTFAQDPKWFTTAPVFAMKNLLEKTNKTVADIDLFEINEAFAVVTMAAQKELSIPNEKVNVHGGAVSLGHPIGASGARIFTTLVHALHAQDKQFGMASICIGGGEAVAVLIERM
ncbi:MAG: thiolase family protein [Bdellovibrionales bacterium]